MGGCYHQRAFIQRGGNRYTGPRYEPQPEPIAGHEPVAEPKSLSGHEPVAKPFTGHEPIAEPFTGHQSVAEPAANLCCDRYRQHDDCRWWWPIQPDLADYQCDHPGNLDECWQRSGTGA